MGKLNYFADFFICNPFIMQILINAICGRIIKSEMIMKSTRTIYKERRYAIEVIASYNEKLLTRRYPVKKTQHLCLRITYSIRVLSSTAEGLIKFVHKDNTFLFNRIEKTCNTWNISRYNNYRISKGGRLNRNHPCCEGFADALVARQNNSEVLIASFESFKHLTYFVAIDSIYLFLNFKCWRDL